jgi:hypothetical protein
MLCRGLFIRLVHDDGHLKQHLDGEGVATFLLDGSTEGIDLRSDLSVSALQRRGSPS